MTMVNTRSQKRRGMPKRATRKNLKNRNAQTKRRGQQKGGENPPPKPPRNPKLAGPMNADLTLTDKILVFDFDATLTTSAGHSGGNETILLNGKYKRDEEGKNIKIDIFGGKLPDLIIHLTLLKDAGYTLYINSRSSRCALLKFFGKLEHQGYIPSSKIKELGNLFTDIYGSIKSSDYIVCNEMNMSNVPPTGTRTEVWVQQKMMVIEDIITKHGGKENITELYFFDDEDGNITKFKEKFKDNKFKGITVDKEGNNLFLLNDLNELYLSTTFILLNKSHIKNKFKSVDRYFKLELPNKLNYYEKNAIDTQKGTIKLDTISDFDSGDDWFSVKFKDENGKDKHFNIKNSKKNDNKDDFNILKRFFQKKDSPIEITVDKMKSLNKSIKPGELARIILPIILKNCNDNNPCGIKYESTSDNEFKIFCHGNSDCKHPNPKLITYSILEEILSNKFSNIEDRPKDSTYNKISINPYTLIVNKKTHLYDVIKYYVSLEFPQSGGRKSKSKSKTKTKKSRSTNPENKRTRKSKK